jgi:prepilin-type N-terminal cleavage/methylation domain-containing protein
VNPRRHAFTLIEVLTVIGIISILVTLAVLGASHISTSTKKNSAHTMMENFKAVMTERAINGGLAPIDALYAPPTIPALPVANQLPAPGDVQIGHVSTGTPPERYNAVGIILTQRVIGLLQASPKIKTMLGQFGATQFLEKIPTGVTAGINKDAVTGTAVPPVFLDPWGNPFIYVPAGGLSGVTKSTGVGANGVSGVTITSPDSRGFWASAGPDGTFTDTMNPAGSQKPFGDDNIYSFEN